MDVQQAAREFQDMHETEVVRRASVIAWYTLYANKLPTMHPHRSDVDLIRTIALWMVLTDKGGRPGFPYDYKSELTFPSINPSEPTSPSITWGVGAAVLVGGLITLCINWKIGLALIVAGPLILVAAYQFGGGATNPNLMKEGTTLFEREGRRALEWATRRSSHNSAST